MKTLLETLQTSIQEARVLPLFKKFTTKEPSIDQDQWIQLNFTDSFWEQTADPCYVLISEISDKSCSGMWTAAYNLGKDRSRKTIQVEINYWDGSGWATFAVAHQQTRRRMWHPEWANWKE